ncbi:MAG: hypothetical protein ABIF17_03820 [Patescibacteria group bacterium]
MQDDFLEQQSWYYKIAYFFISNQILLKRLFLFLLIFANIIIWLCVVVLFTNYLTDTKSYNYAISLISKDRIDFTAYKVTHSPKNISILDSYVVARSDGRYDFLAKIKNLNVNWAAGVLKYKFSYPGGQTEEKIDFVLPGKEKYLFVFGHEIDFPIDHAKLVIQETGWYRIKNSENLSILNDIFASEEEFVRFDKSSAVQFSVNNKSPYSFWSVGWQVVLYRGSDPIAFSYVTTNQLLAVSSYDTQTTWFENLSTPTRIDIISDVDILSSDVFMKVDYGPGRPPGLGN